MLPVSLDCPSLIALLLFSNIYLMLEVIVRFVCIGGNVDHHCISFHFITYDIFTHSLLRTLLFVVL
jgi:hypothetical protein